jgi:hypothetical protein
MGEIYIPRDQQNALAAINASELEGLLDQAIQEERSNGLHRLALANCGPYVAGKYRYFHEALAKYRDAKSSRKREQMGDSLRRAAHDLSFAVRAMKQRMETEDKESQLFVVDDQIMQPFHFSKHMSVMVSYRWRRTVDDDWNHGSITFVHDVDLRPDYTTPAPKRKPSAAKREEELQYRLYQTWEHLMRGVLYSVRDYFRDGGDGDKIPETFKVTVDSYSRGLNNYSMQFWRQQP